MELKRVLICVALMALVTYIPRVLPVTVFRKQIRSRFIRSFLDYTPYAVLGALTFPDVFFSTGHLFSAAGGTAVAIVLGYKGKSLVVVAVAAIAAVYILELLAGACRGGKEDSARRDTKQDIRQNTKAEMRKRQ